MGSPTSCQSFDSNGLAKLWYIPHLAEILVAMDAPEKTQKATNDLSLNAFKNPQIYQKSTKINLLLYELFSVMVVFADLLQNNRKYTGSVKQLRVADYVVNNLNLLKRDIFTQGEKAEYGRVEPFIASRWNYWYLKLKFGIGKAMHALDVALVYLI